MVFILIIRVFIIKKLVFILNRGLMSKTGFYSEKLVYFIFIIYSKTENILSLELQCMNIPTSQQPTGNKQQATQQHLKKTLYQFYCRNLKPNITSILGFVQSSLKLKMKPVRPPPFVTTSWVPFRWKLTHRISSFPLSSFRLPRDSNPGPRVFNPMGSISGTN